MAQTIQYGFIEGAVGHRFVVQSGRHKFAAKGKTARLTIGFDRLVSGRALPAAALAAAKRTSGIQGYFPYIGSAQITQHLNRVVVVSRPTSNANVSGLYFDYSLYGF